LPPPCAFILLSVARSSVLKMLASLASSQPLVDDAIDPHHAESVTESKLEAAIVTLPCALVDWDGPDDPGNPKTWSMTSRIFHTAIPALFGLAA